jgi:hypothetical protein|tara:strand:- start:3517 stop:3753 length:237 start_codon:yes stop_codon:yes gene_type:complete|eukprot:29146-Pelagococcus_subviridis.AAC.1
MEWPSEDDPELHALHKERIQQMKEEQEKRKVMESKGHGTYADVNEGEFLPEVTGAFQARSRSQPVAIRPRRRGERRFF